MRTFQDLDHGLCLPVDGGICLETLDAGHFRQVNCSSLAQHIE